MKKTLYAVLAVLLLSSLVSASDEQIADPQIDSLYLRASLYDYEGNFEEAANLYEQILQEIDSEYVYSKLAGDYARLNDTQSMKLTLERGLRHNPDSVILTGLLADVYKLNPDTVQKSYEMFQKAYDLSKENIYLEGLASAYTLSKDYNSAINVYDTLIAKDKKSEYYVNRGRLYALLGLEKESLEDYGSAVEIDGNTYASSKLADYYIGKNDVETAIKYLKNVIAGNPDNILTKFRLAELLKRVGKTQDAVKYYESLIGSLSGNELSYVLKQLATESYNTGSLDKAQKYFEMAYDNEKDIKTAYSIAVISEARGDVENAEKWYKRIVADRPDFADAKKRLAIIYLKKKMPKEALETLQGLDRIYMDVEYFRILAEAYGENKEYYLAEKTLADAIDENPTEIKLRLDLAVLYDEHGQRDKAIDVAKEGLKVNPDNESFLNFLGYMYAEEGVNLKEARKMVKRALEKKPNEAAYLDSMAWILYKMGKYKDAYDFQKKALKGAPDEQEIQDHMKAILEKLRINKSIEDVLKED